MAEKPVNKINHMSKTMRWFPSIGLKITASCRLDCPFCCEPDRTQKPIPIENFIKITDKIFGSGTRRLCFTGGEPLLYPSLNQLLKHSKLLGFYNLLLTSDGELLKKNKEIFPSIDAVRFSIHEMNSRHDAIVKCSGSFREIDEAIDLLIDAKIPSFVTSVLTVLNKDSIFDVAEWCFQKKVKKYFLFSLMRSGLGDTFLKKNGELLSDEISEIVSKLKRKYSNTQMEIIYYDNSNNAQCVLIYGDGRVLIDPYANAPTFQLEIGNILTDEPAAIYDRFLQDPSNYEGYSRHLRLLKIK